MSLIRAGRTKQYRHIYHFPVIRFHSLPRRRHHRRRHHSRTLYRIHCNRR